MKRMFRPALLAGLAAVIGLGLATSSPADEDGFKSLFDGKTFAGWKFVIGGKETEPGKTFTIQDKTIIVSGSPNGYIVTEKSYKNYVIRYDWRYKRPSDLGDDEEKFAGNSGLLVHIQGLPKKGTWPTCVEVQGENRTHGNIFAIGGAKGSYKFDVKKLREVRKKIGEWNTTEVICKDGEITSKVNGTQVASGKGELTEGPIGLQSEGAEIHFKNIQIKVLD